VPGGEGRELVVGGQFDGLATLDEFEEPRLAGVAGVAEDVPVVVDPGEGGEFVAPVADPQGGHVPEDEGRVRVAAGVTGAGAVGERREVLGERQLVGSGVQAVEGSFGVLLPGRVGFLVLPGHR
jgi:hypothetical protein